MSVDRGEVTAVRALAEAAERQGDREFVQWVSAGTRTSYADAYGLAVRWAGVLFERGVRRSDRVALLLPNTDAFLGALLGSWLLGAISVPLNLELRGESLRHPLRLYEPAAVVVADGMLPVLEAALPDPPFRVLTVSPDGTTPGWHEASPASPKDPALWDPCLIMSTSGTTGLSKGTVWDYGTLRQWVSTFRRRLAYDEDDRIYCCTPLFHANSLASGVLTALDAGAAVVLAERFSVSRFWPEVAASRATSANLLGSMIDLLLADETEAARDARSRAAVRTMLVSSCSERAFRAMRGRWGITPVSAYGLTDFGTIVASEYGAEAPPGSVGRPIEDFEVRLVDGDDRDVAPGEAGELVVRPVRAWTAPQEYFRMPEQTLASRRNLWFHTGDLLRSDDDGWWYFAGRVKDSMRRRGENVSAFEIEHLVLEVPGIQEAAAYAVPAAENEDEIALAVVVAPGAGELDRLALIERLAAELPYFAVPRYLRVLDELPKTPTHRVTKDVLRRAGVTADTWDRVAAGFEVARNRRGPDESAARPVNVRIDSAEPGP